MKRTSVLILGIEFLLVLTMAGTALAQGPEPSDDEVNAIAEQLYCPVCENIPLDVCSTTACEQWRETIREKLTLGWSEDQIIQYFVDYYGDRVLATPPARGFNWLVYILPPIVIIIGAIFLIRALRGWTKVKKEDHEGIVDTVKSQDPYILRLEEELRRRESG